MKKLLVFVLCLTVFLFATGSSLYLDGKPTIFTICLLDAIPAGDDTYTGTVITGVAGETLAQWDIVYNKNSSGANKWYKYNAATGFGDKAQGARAMVVSALSSGVSGVFLIDGIVRNDGWAFTDNQDEGKLIYSGETAGAITVTIPSDSGDQVQILGHMFDENVIRFRPTLVLIEV